MKKGMYIVKPGYTIKHDGTEYKEGSEIELTKEQAENLHVESAEQHKARKVLEGKDSYADSPAPNTKRLVGQIELAQHAETVEVLMSFSTVKAVASAGNKRLKELEEAAKEVIVSGSIITVDSLIAQAKVAKSFDELVAIEKLAVNNLELSDFDYVNTAIEARKKELKG